MPPVPGAVVCAKQCMLERLTFITAAEAHAAHGGVRVWMGLTISPTGFL